MESTWQDVDPDINGDVNQDGTFDQGDTGAFSALLGGPATALLDKVSSNTRYTAGQASGATHVPEPSAWVLVLMAVSAVMGYGRFRFQI